MDRATSSDASEAPSSAASDRLLIVLCVSMFLAVINFAAASPFFPKMARDLHTSVPLLGQITTVTTILSAMVGLGIGPLADRYGHRRLLLGGMIAVAVNLVGTGLAPSYPVLLGLAVLGGLGDSVLFGLPLAIAGSHFSGAMRQRAIGWTSAALPLGATLGIPVLTAIGGVVGWRAAVAGAGVAAFASVWLALIWLPPDHTRPEEPLRIGTLIDAYRPLLRHRSVVMIYLASGLRMACWIGLFTYLGSYLSDELDFGAVGVGAAYAAAGAGAFAGSLLAAREAGQIPPRTLAAMAMIVHGLILGVAFIVALGSGVTIGLLLLAGVAGSISFVGVTMLLNRESRGGAATTMVFNGSVLNLGSAIGVGIGGLLIAVGGYQALGFGLPIFALVAGLLVWRPDRREAPTVSTAAQ